MEKELAPEIIKATQNSLGKYVKRPPLSEKLLKKPPFRFLHDIITTVLKTTGFFEGLFEENELVSENVKEREGKILFLTKIITVLNITTGKTLAAKPSKIVAGQDPEKTNELLQCLAQALDQKLSSEEAVKQVKQGKTSQTSTKTKPDPKVKEPVKVLKKSNDPKKLTSKSNEKLTSSRKDPSDRLSKVTSEKSSTNKTKSKDISIKKEPTKSSINGQNKKPKIVDKTPKLQAEKSQEDLNSQTLKNDAISASEFLTEQTTAKEEESINSLQLTQINNTETEAKKLNSSYTIGDELNSSLSSQDLMEVESEKPIKQHEDSFENVNASPNIATDSISESKRHIASPEKSVNGGERNKISLNGGTENKINPVRIEQANNVNDTERKTYTKEIENIFDRQDSFKEQTNASGDKAVTKRPLSVRPSSSRPGAPRLREKHDNIIADTDNILVGKVNIIVENTSKEEEEDTSIIIIDESSSSLQDEKQQLQLSSNQHGHLVQQILDSQKELTHKTGKTEIEWQFGGQKAKEATYQEIEQLRFNIQSLSRVANPLGKLLDHIQEDVEVMRQELMQWKKTYDETSKELAKQKTLNEDSLFPLHTKLKQLDADIEEKRDKINDLKVVIHKNSTRIEKLLASGDVQ